jgi:hypothetical protein
MSEHVSAVEPVLWKTALAIIAAIVIAAVVSSVIAILMGIVNALFNPDMHFFNDIWEQIVGGSLGVYAARFVCDRFLQPYSRHVVFTVIALLTIGIIAFSYFALYLRGWVLVTESANAIAMIVAAYILFWQGAPTDDFV